MATIRIRKVDPTTGATRYKDVDRDRWLATVGVDRNGWLAEDEPGPAAAAFNDKLATRVDPMPAWAKQEAPQVYTYVNPQTGHEIQLKQNKVNAKGGEALVPPGYERKYPGGLVGGVRAAGQTIALNGMDDILDATIGDGKGKYQDLYEGTARENPLLWNLVGLPAAMLSPNPLKVAAAPVRGVANLVKSAAPAVADAVSAVGGAARIGAPGLAKAASGAADFTGALTSEGLVNMPRVPAMLAQTGRATAQGTAANFGAQPQGQKDLGAAVTNGGADAFAMSLGAQALGGTGGGYFLQTPQAARTPSTSGLPTMPLEPPRPAYSGINLSLLNPMTHFRGAARLLNEEVLAEEGGRARISAGQVSPTQVREVAQTRSRQVSPTNQTAAGVGEALNEFKVPQTFLPPTPAPSLRPSTWAPNLRERLPWTQKFLGTGEKPLLGPGMGAEEAGPVFTQAADDAGAMISRIESRAPDMDVVPVLGAARNEVDVARQRLLAGDDVGANVSTAIDNAESKLNPTTRIEVPVYGPRATGHAPATTVETLVTRPRVLGDTRITEKREVPNPAYRETQVPLPPVEVQPARMMTNGEPRTIPNPQYHGPVGPDPWGKAYPPRDVPAEIPNPAFREWEVPAVTQSPGTRTMGLEGVSPTMTVEEVVRPQPPIKDVVKRGFIGPTPMRNAVVGSKPVDVRPGMRDQPVSTVQQLRNELRDKGVAGYADDSLARSDASIFASTEGAVGRMMEDHLRATLSPEEFQKFMEAKRMFQMARIGQEANNEFKPIARAGQSLTGEIKANTAAGVAASVAGPAAAVAVRPVVRTVDRQYPINPNKAYSNQRLVEGIRGEGIDTAAQAKGAIARFTREVPERVNRGLASEVGEDGGIMQSDFETPAEDGASMWQTILDRLAKSGKLSYDALKR